MAMKRLVVCCDGTWNTAKQMGKGGPRPTNVARIDQAVQRGMVDGVDQVCFYEPGVGTTWGERVRGGAFGFGLSRNVCHAYRFLVEHFEPGDEIFFFGFSRGAFTVRSAAGFVRNTGILRPEHADRITEAYELYRSRDKHPGSDEAERFRRAHSHETRIHFIGVWDTVGALGIPLSGLRAVNLFNRRWQFHDTELSSWVGNAFHALSIDEDRGAFRPAIWTTKPEANQRVEQVWFAGCHSDVGGGYPVPQLAEIALLWMVNRARECGLVFVPGAFPILPEHPGPGRRDRIAFVDPDPLGDLHRSRVGLYRVLPAFTRRLGEVNEPNEAVAETAVQRHDKLHDYAPPGLVDYLGKEPRVVPV